MAGNTVSLRWTGTGMQFEGGKAGEPFVVVDGNGRAGPSPMATLLLALGGCTASDVVEIAGKMRVDIGSLDVEVDGERASDPPRRYTRIRMRYRIGGVTQEAEARIRRAVDLSHEKYCSVLHSLRPDLEMSSELEFA
jgi:putative redox protein